MVPGLSALNVIHVRSSVSVFFTSVEGTYSQYISGKKIPLGNLYQYNFFKERGKWLWCDTVIYDIFTSTAWISDRYY